MGTVTDVDIVNRALLLLGEDQIASLSEGTATARIAKEMYDHVVDDELASRPWRFAMTKLALSRLNETPINEWAYVFQLPADLLTAIRVDVGLYEILGRKLYSNNKALILEYTKAPLPGEFPSWLLQRQA